MLIPNFSLPESALTTQNTCIISSTSATANNNSKQLDVRKPQLYHGMTHCLYSNKIADGSAEKAFHRPRLDLWKMLEITFELQQILLLLFMTLIVN